MALFDLFEVKLRGLDFDNEAWENVFFYRHSAQRGLDFDTDEEALAVGFKEAVWDTYKARLNVSWRCVEIRVRNLFNDNYSYVLPVNEVGTRPAIPGNENMPTFNVGKITMGVAPGAVRKGQKAIAGITEADAAGKVLTALGIVNFTVLAATFVLWLADSTLLGQKSFEPVVVKRVREGTPGNYTYRLPTSSVEAVYAAIQSAVLSATVRHQTTRD